MKYSRVISGLVLLVCLLSGNLFAAGIKDSESASHDDSAAKYVVEAVYQGDGFKITQFNLGVLSHYSYIIESEGKALMVDPGRDIGAYLDFAKENRLEWVGTFLSHAHADFVAGHREMAQATGSPIYASHLSGNLFPHLAVKEGDKIEIGSAMLKVIETPGHTPDALCALVSSRQNPDRGQFLLSGDTLFVGSVGRPDLMGGSYSAAELAGMMFHTWNSKLARLADSVVVLPAHGAGSLCGANLRDEPSSTIGQEKKSNAYVKFANDRSAFITAVLTGLSEAPAYFKENAAMNRRGPEIVDWANPLGKKIASLDGLTLKKDVYIIDLREAGAYSAGHIAASVNVALRGRLETWVGTLVPFNSRIILRGSETEVLEGSRRLKRVGYDADYLDFSLTFNDISTPMTEPVKLYKSMQAGNAPVIVDVRKPDEWLGMRIGEVLNLPLNKLEALAKTKLNPADEVVAVCNSAFRSSLAVGLLERAGFRNVSSMNGGAEAWVEAGLPVVKIEAGKTAAQSDNEFRNLGLPELISAAELLRKLKDLPGSLEVIDVRPAEQVNAYNPLNATAVEFAELIESQAWLSGEVPLVVVDRDGSMALMAAAIISRKTRRPLKVLRGGIEALWRESEAGFIKDRMLQPDAAIEKAPGTAPVQPQPIQPAKPAKKKSAGC